MKTAASALPILQALAGEGGEMSLPRLSKRLGHSASALLRELSFLSDAVLGGQRGPGWVRVWQQDGRWMVALTPAGARHAAPLGAAGGRLQVAHAPGQ